MAESKRRSPTRAYLEVLGALALTVSVLTLAKEVIVPLALAVLLTFVLSPLVRAVEQRIGVRRLAAVFLVALLAFAIIGTTSWMVGAQVHGLVKDLPKHQREIAVKVEGIRAAGGAFGKLVQMFREIDEQTARPPGSEPKPLESAPPILVAPLDQRSNLAELWQALEPVLAPLAATGLVVVLVVFMLINHENLRDRLIGLFGHGRLTGTTRALDDAAHRVGQFLLAQLGVNAGFGVVLALGLWVIGVPYAFLWGFLATVLRFVPYIGSWLAASFPLVLSFALSPGWRQPVLVGAFFVLLDLVTANIIEPLTFGHRTGVTPLALLVAAAFWTWVWGPVGLVLSTPLTVCLVVLGQHIPQMGFLSLLLSDQPPLPPYAGYYQRLLAHDKTEAEKRALEYAHERGVEAVYEDMILPTLLRARQDRQQGGLTADEETYVLETTSDILIALDTPPSEPVMVEASEGSLPSVAPETNGNAHPATAEVDSPPPVLVFGCPAHHVAEELTLKMLGRLMRSDGCQLEVLSSRLLASEVVARVAKEAPALVLIGSIPPGGREQAAYLCRVLRKQFPDLRIIVGYWGSVTNFDQLLLRLRRAGASYVTTTLLQSRAQIRSLIHPESATEHAARGASWAEQSGQPHSKKMEAHAPGAAR